MARQKKQLKIGVHVQVLQNGHTIASTTAPLSRSKTLALTDDRGKDLSVPHFPLPNGYLDFIRIDDRKVTLFVDYNWEGFCTTNGSLQDISLSEKGRREFDIANGDYGSISRGDLRILFKVGPISSIKEIRHKIPRSYRGSFWSGYVPREGEWPVTFAAMAFLAVVMVGIVFGFRQRGYYKPRVVDELTKEYVIPFVSEYHLKYAPEALQSNLDRRHFLRSTLAFYRSLTGVMMGWRDADTSHMFPTTVALYRSLYASTASKIEKIYAEQRTINEKLLAKELSVLSIPAVVGESVGGSVMRILDKINIAHQGFDQALTSRRETTKAFNEDRMGDPENYKGAGLAAGARSRLSQIKGAFVARSDEELMYESALKLAFEARTARAKIAGQESMGIKLTPVNSVPLALPPGVSFASFVDDIDFMSADARIDELEGKQFANRGARKSFPPKPLTGVIDRDAIRDYIEGNRYQLKLCYDVALRRNQAAQGTMEWSFRIDTRGQIYEIALISSTIKDEKMAQCIRQKLAKWQFPRPRHGSVEIRYPFQFAPAKG